jgi:hypothetical protein
MGGKYQTMLQISCCHVLKHIECLYQVIIFIYSFPALTYIYVYMLYKKLQNASCESILNSYIQNLKTSIHKFKAVDNYIQTCLLCFGKSHSFNNVRLLLYLLYICHPLNHPPPHPTPPSQQPKTIHIVCAYAYHILHQNLYYEINI